MKRFFVIVVVLFCCFLSGCDMIMPKEKFTVTFDSNGGSEVASQQVEKGSAVAKPDDPTKEGYDFDGWYADEEKWSFNGYVVSKDLTLTAKWLVKKYTLTIKYNDDKTEDYVQSLEAGTVLSINTPAREGYSFKGWNTQIPATMPMSDLTIEAIWKINKYTLKITNYTPNEDLELEFEYNQKIELPKQIYNDSLYRFNGYDSEIPDRMPAYDENIAGYWSLKSGTAIKVARVTSQNDANRVQVGHTLQFSYNVTPGEAYVDSVKWSVNSNLATIDENGLLTAGNEVGLVKVIVEVSDTINTVQASKNILIVQEEVIVYPNLGEYTIKIAEASTRLGNTNPFMPIETRETYGYYSGADREARQQAWQSVEEDFNCHITVVEYPSDAPWGPSRWNYIINQARIDSPEYDFYIVPTAQIPTLSSQTAILDVTSWYNKYGNDYMSSFAKLAGSYKNKLYAVSNQEKSIYNILGYNVGLWEIIHEYDPTIKEPAQMFLDGEWNYTNFVTYCKKCQDVLHTAYGYGYDSGYYCLSGWPTYYFVGMVDRNGEGVADISKLKVHIVDEDCVNAIEAIRELYNYGAFDPSFNVDRSVMSWANCKSLFNTGDLWFVNDNNRWVSNMWGEGEATRYGYVPFPAPDRMGNNDHIYIGTTTEESWVMAAGRDNFYKGYGESCTAENIYYAVASYWQRIKSIYQESDLYNPNEALTIAQSKFATQASANAFVLVCSKLETDGFYDPMTSSNNTVCATYGTDFDRSLRTYVKGTGANTWAEAVGSMQETLNNAIVKAFG